MGILVCFAMFIALLMLCFIDVLKSEKYQIYTKFVGVLIALAGLWNFAWYGTQNLPSFWGVTALLSGFFMLFSAQMIYLEVRESSFVNHSLYSDFKLIIKFVLALYFFLYMITIVQINLGMPILR